MAISVRTILVVFVASILPVSGFQRLPVQVPCRRHHDTGHSPVRSGNVVQQMWSGDDDIQGSDRFKACFPYLLPLLDGDQFGTFIHQRIPPLGAANDLFLGPLLDIYHAVPFSGIIFFLILTLGTRGATDMSRAVRFNAQQAALIDVALIFPELIANSFEEEPLPRYIAEPCANFVFYAYMSAVIYSIWSNLSGKKPNKIPYLSNWAEMAVGPF